MSHVGHPTLSTRSQLRVHWIAVVSAFAALLAAVAVVLVLALDDRASSPTTGSGAPQAALRHDGPNESAVAASIAPHPNLSPLEAARAALVGQGAGPYQPASEGPDESAVAASISGR